MIVLDCSAAVNMVQGTTEGNALLALIYENEKVISSELFAVEAANTFWRYVKQGKASDKEAFIHLRDAVALVDEFIPIHENYEEAFHESIRLNHSTYDMLYFTLARRNAATLVTLDAKLMDLCDEQGVDCIVEVEI